MSTPETPAKADMPSRTPITERDMLASMEVLASARPDPEEIMVLTDEELLALGGEDALSLLGAPYLTQPGIDAGSSAAAALRSLAARHLVGPRGEDAEPEGDLVVSEPGDEQRPVQLERSLAGVTTLRRIPEGMVVVERTLAGGSTRLCEYLFPGDGVLEEYVTVDGFHHFSVPRLEEVPERLAVFVDTFEDASADGEAEEMPLDGEQMQALFAGARSLSVVTSIKDSASAQATFCAVPGQMRMVDNGPVGTSSEAGRPVAVGDVSAQGLREALALLVPRLSSEGDQE